MTDVTLPYSRTDAATVVKAAFERMENVETYEVVEGGSVIVGTTGGGLTSFGEEVVVAFPEIRGESTAERDEPESETVVSVTSQAKSAYNLSANPWKQKTEFVEQLHELKGKKVEEVELEVTEERDEPSDSDPAGDSADALILGGAFMLVILLGLLLIVALLAAIAIVV